MTKYHECCCNRNVVISRAHRPKAATSDTRHEDDGARRRRTHARAIINTAFGTARPRTPPANEVPGDGDDDELVHVIRSGRPVSVRVARRGRERLVYGRRGGGTRLTA